MVVSDDDELKFDEIVVNLDLDEVLARLAMARRRVGMFPNAIDLWHHLDELFTDESLDEGNLRIMLALCLNRLIDAVDPEVK